MNTALRQLVTALEAGPVQQLQHEAVHEARNG